MADVMDYHVTDPSGKADVIGNTMLQQHLTEQGYPVVGTSADGQTLTFQDEKGKPYQVAADDALKELGYQVHEKVPTTPNFEHVQPSWRAAVENSQDDPHAKAYLESRLSTNGGDKPQVVGSGHNWYVFNPHTSQWLGVTNNPNEWGMADVLGAGTKVLPTAGAVLGGLGGAVTTGPIGAALGAGGGDALGRWANRALQASYDPSYEKTNPVSPLDQDPENELKDLGAAAGGQLAGMGMGTAAEGVSPLLKGPLSSIARGGGKVMDALGRGLEGAAGFVKNNPVARWLAEEGGPLSDVANPALSAQIPRYIASSAMKLGRRVSGGMAEESPEWLQALTKEGPPSAPPMTERFANAVAGKETPMVRSSPAVDLGRNIGEMAGMKVGGMANSPQAEESAVHALRSHLAKHPEFAGQTPEAMSGAEDVLRGGLRDASKAGAEATSARWGEAGAGLGRAVDTIGGAGDAVANGASKVIGAGLTGAQGIGSAMKYGGQALQGAGNIGRETELPAYAQLMQDYLRRKYLRQGPQSSNITGKTTLADTQ